MMQEYKEPLFSKGRVLKKESLEALRDFPEELSRLYLSGWSDGILCGLGVSYAEGQLSMEAGAVWQDGDIVLVRPEIFPFTQYEKQVTVCLRLYPPASTEDFAVRPLEVLVKNGEPEENELELGRFCLSEGARLRKEYRDLKDFRTAHNTLDITRIRYAGPGGVTMSPVLLRAFGRAVLENEAAGDWDVGFAFQCLRHPNVERECLLRYLSRRLGEPYQEELSHNEIYERLVRIGGSGSRSRGPGHRKEGPAVI